ncbi:hypothetical protein ACJX0J_041798, partial [Zea mays]
RAGAREQESPGRRGALQPADWRSWRGREEEPQRPRRYSFRRHRSGAAEWAAVVLFMVLAVVVLLGAVAVLVVVLLQQPRVPGVLPLAYVARTQGAPLGDAGSAAMEAALRDGVVPFRVDGEARTRWKVAGIIGVDQWTRLACQLRFFWPNGTVLPFRCISKSKFLFF